MNITIHYGSGMRYHTVRDTNASPGVYNPARHMVTFNTWGGREKLSLRGSKAELLAFAHDLIVAVSDHPRRLEQQKETAKIAELEAELGRLRKMRALGGA